MAAALHNTEFLSLKQVMSGDYSAKSKMDFHLVPSIVEACHSDETYQ
jgi:hypothetical protein